MLKIGLLIPILIATVCATRTVNNHLSTSDWTRLQKVFAEGLKSSDIQSIYYSALNIKDLTSEEKASVCKRLMQIHQDSKLNDFEKNFYLIGTLKTLECSETLPDNVLQSIQNSLAKDATTAQEVYFNYYSTKLSGNIEDSVKVKVAKNLQQILKKDDSLSSLGNAFYVASELGTNGAFVFDRIEDAIVQADEVDGKMLQFEGGLSITSLVINGALKLTTALEKPSPITSDQAVKFAAYFLSRSSVQTPKGASVLLEALKIIAGQNNVAPVCIQLAGNGQLQPESPVISVKVTDLLGDPLKPALAVLSTTVTSKESKSALVSKVNFVPSRSDSTLFTYDLSKASPTRGQYLVDIDAGIYKQKLNVNILGKVKVSSMEIGIGDSESTTSLKKQPVDYPSKLAEVLSADSTQKVVLKTSLADESSGKAISVHQAFVLLKNQKSGEEIIFVAEQDSSKAYKFEMDVGARSGDFGHKSGQYTLELMVGDALLSNSFRWVISDINLKFSQEAAKAASQYTRKPLPEIVHKFREPEKRPPRFLSDLFTGLCLAPLALLFVLWIRIRVNISGFPLSLSALGFHLGFGGILLLFVVFWLQMNMFETIRCLMPLSLVTFLCGNKLLRSIASKSSDK